MNGRSQRSVWIAFMGRRSAGTCDEASRSACCSLPASHSLIPGGSPASRHNPLEQEKNALRAHLPVTPPRPSRVAPTPAQVSSIAVHDPLLYFRVLFLSDSCCLTQSEVASC
jgi:hypothetical protein